jgi:hypothetical protein
LPLLVVTRSWAMRQLDCWIPGSTGVMVSCGDPVLQLLGVAKPIRDALHGMSGHLSSSTRGFPKYGVNFL